MTLDNSIIKISVNDHGAELKSLIKNNREYMWCGNPEYWGRTSPVLFPFVGSLKDKKYSTEGKEYSMGQHGFARDMDFRLVEKTDNSLSYELKSGIDTLEKYPYNFILTITYKLTDSELEVIWDVINTDTKPMPFSIGAHPAFNLKSGTNYFKFDTQKDITYRLLTSEGLLDKSENHILDNNGYSVIKNSMFDNDALIIENNQANEVSLCDENKNPYITVKFTSPLFGLWSPAGKNAPFVCIEPWYGRCDSSDFVGDLKDREYTNILNPQCSFHASYTIYVI